MSTATEMQPPDRGCGAIATADDDGDYIRELGDQIADLTILQAAELTAYIESKGLTRWFANPN